MRVLLRIVARFAGIMLVIVGAIVFSFAAGQWDKMPYYWEGRTDARPFKWRHTAEPAVRTAIENDRFNIGLAGGIAMLAGVALSVAANPKKINTSEATPA